MTQRTWRYGLAVLLAGLGLGAGPQDFRATLQRHVEAVPAATGSQPAGLVVTGRDGWYFLARELQAYAVPPAASQPASAPGDDALGAILDFAAQCRRQDVALIVVPVPGKVSVYPDQLDASLPPGPRADERHQQLYEQLRAGGVTVLDLQPAFAELRRKGRDPFCRQDTHWSPAGVALAAEKLAELVRPMPWFSAVPKKLCLVGREKVAARGDLAALAGDAGVPPEVLVTEPVSYDGQPVEPQRESPIVLLGDSHALVYHQPIDGGIAASGAGLGDQLAGRLGVAVDLVANQAGGANAGRIVLARRKDNLKGKKLVIWCFAARELTAPAEAWKALPVVR